MGDLLGTVAEWRDGARMRRFAVTPRALTLMALSFFVQTTSGCLSHAYVIPRDELMRQALLPHEARGERVRLVQSLGERRAEPLPEPPLTESPPAAVATERSIVPAERIADEPLDGDLDEHLHGDLTDASDAGDCDPTEPDSCSPHLAVRIDGPSSRESRGGGHGAGGHRAHRDAVDVHGAATTSPVASRGSVTTTHGGGRSAVVVRGTAPSSSSSSSSSSFSRGSGSHPSGGFAGSASGASGGGGGGGGGNDAAAALAILAVVAVAAAVVTVVALAASEGARFDGYAQMSPEQPVHLRSDLHPDNTISLADLTPELIDVTTEATVADDEGSGLRRLDRAPLNRTGGTYKLSLGTTSFNYQTSRLVGPAANIQVGGFFTPTVGLLLDIGLGGATDCCTGATVVRHSFGLELQALPLTLGRRAHLGVFAKGGMALVGAAILESGPVADGGALVELDLGTRLALTLRAGVSAARLDSGWSSAAMITAGIAVY